MIDAFVTTIKRTSIANRSLYYMCAPKEKMMFINNPEWNYKVLEWNRESEKKRHEIKKICTNEDIQIKSGILPENE